MCPFASKPRVRFNTDVVLKGPSKTSGHSKFFILQNAVFEFIWGRLSAKPTINGIVRNYNKYLQYWKFDISKFIPDAGSFYFLEIARAYDSCNFSGHMAETYFII